MANSLFTAPFFSAPGSLIVGRANSCAALRVYGRRVEVGYWYWGSAMRTAWSAVAALGSLRYVASQAVGHVYIEDNRRTSFCVLDSELT
jgi:hypothetical protein